MDKSDDVADRHLHKAVASITCLVPPKKRSMIQAINPFTPPFVHHYIQTPFREGIARIETARKGVPLHSFIKPPIAWDKRIIYLLTGCILVLPLLGTIAWVAMKTFGNPEQFAPSLPTEPIAVQRDPLLLPTPAKLSRAASPSPARSAPPPSSPVEPQTSPVSSPPIEVEVVYFAKKKRT